MHDFQLNLPNDHLTSHLFVLAARSDYFNTLAESPMIESNQMSTQVQLGPLTRARPLFKSFVKFLYTDELALPEGDGLKVEEALWLCELNEFYGLSSDRFKALAEAQVTA